MANAKRQLVWKAPAQVRLVRSGPLWTAQLIVTTPTGPICFSAGVDTRLVAKAIEAKIAANGGASGGIFDGIKKIASKVAKVVALDKVASVASKYAPTPANAVRLLPRSLRTKAEKAATSLLARAMGGEANAKRALGALKVAASSLDAREQYKRAWGTVKKVHRVLNKGGGVANMAKGVTSALIHDSFAAARPATAAIDVAESQFRRLPGPLGSAARVTFQAMPGVSQAYALHGLQQAWQRGRLPNVAQAASFLPGAPGQWAQQAAPYVGYAPRSGPTRYPYGYAAGR